MSAQEQERWPQLEPREWPEPWMGPFLEALAQIPIVSTAAKLVQVHRVTAYRHAQRDPEFREAWRAAVAIGNELIERIAHQRATTGWQSEETRRKVKRALNEAGELVVVEEETVTVTRNEVSDALMIQVLKANMPRKYREQIEHHVSPGEDPMLEAPPTDDQDDGIHRVPTRERAIALAKLALELEPGLADELRQNGRGE